MPRHKAASSAASIPKFAVLAVFVGGVALILFNLIAANGTSVGGSSAGRGEQSSVNVMVPAKFSRLAEEGRVLFEQTCAACHGRNAAGTDRGPPLVHDLYNPGHHSDDAFVLAARMGVRAHHWRFGNMPPQPLVPEAQARAIALYVRELQAANGIVTRPHRM